MRVEIRERFEGATLREVEHLYMLDDEFNQAAFEQMGYGRKVLAFSQRGSELERSLQLCPRSGLPAPFSALVPSSVFHITEQVSYDLALHRGSWRTVPSVLSKQFSAAGSLALEQASDAVIFRLEGEAKAQIPLLSARAERQAVATAVAQHAALAKCIRERLDASRRVTSYQVISA
jgi:hypothetical protein